MANKSNPNFDVELDISTTFQKPELTTWREIATRSLRGRNLDELVTSTFEGIDVDPLYVADVDREPVESSILFHRPEKAETGAWRACELVDSAEIERVSEAVASARTRGVEAVWLRLDRMLRQGKDLGNSEPQDDPTDGLLTTDVGEVAGIFQALQAARLQVFLDGGCSTVWLLAVLASLARDNGLDVGDISGSVGWDPLGCLASEAETELSVERALSITPGMVAWTRRHFPSLRTLSISCLPYHEAGATAVQELSFGIATGVEYLRVMLAAGSDLSTSCAELGFRVGIGRDLFMEAAKLRALRSLWARVVEAAGGEPCDQGVPIHAVTAPRGLSRYDCWTNLLRTTVATIAAATGGADAISVLPPATALGAVDETGCRVAVNTHALLREEGQLGNVGDPAAGSWYVEHLTDELAQAAWTLFQEIESRGGMKNCLLDGTVQGWLGEVLSAKNESVAYRAEPITGVSIFPNLGENQGPDTDDSLLGRSRARARLDVQYATCDPTLELARMMKAADHEIEKGKWLEHAVEAVTAGAAPHQIVAALASAQPTRLDAPLARQREGEGFEVLRDASEAWARSHGHRPRAAVLALGDPTAHRVRLMFTQNLLAAGGIEAVVETLSPGPDDKSVPVLKSGSNVVVICPSGEIIDEQSEVLVRELKERGATFVMIAADPGAGEESWREAGFDGFVHSGCDVRQRLEEISKALGVMS
jgi:methylmalonyl-CoA mutase